MVASMTPRYLMLKLHENRKFDWKYGNMWKDKSPKTTHKLELFLNLSMIH